jgi:hypothetical protein
MGYVLALLIAAGVIHTTTSDQTLSRKLESLQSDVLITTLGPEELRRHPSLADLEHDTEVARSESVTIVVTIATCEPSEGGSCNASADVVAYQPDGTIHTEVKNLLLNSRRATARLPLSANDPTGLYKVIATVCDLNARRLGKAERSFGVK